MSERKGPATLVVMAVVSLAALLGGWFVYDASKPRHPLDSLFRQVIAEAPMPTDRLGFQRVDVSDRICDKVEPYTLTAFGLTPSYRETTPFAGSDDLERADVWSVREEKNFLAQCLDHSVKYLTIQIQRGTNQCRAFVSEAPTCDP